MHSTCRISVFLFLISALAIGAAKLTDKSVKVTLYFHDASKSTAGSPCFNEKAVTKRIRTAGHIHQAALVELLKGQELGRYLKKVEISGHTARVHFAGAASSLLNSPACQQESIKAPIEKTLKSIPPVRDVEYWLDGELITDWDA